MIATATNPNLALAEEVSHFIRDPLGHARCVYPWGEGELIDAPGPRAWQGEVLGEIGKHVINPATRYIPLLIAICKGHGIGGSALAAMVTNWAMDTCDDCKVVVTANTGTQLATKTQPEMAKWRALSITKGWWDVKATSITSKVPGHERLWRADFIPWSENNTEAFAGLHNQGRCIIVVFDEASGIADKVWEVMEGALTDEATVIIVLVLGNPTLNTGRFRDCFGRLKHRWRTWQIDSRTVEGTNKEQIAQWIADYGEDSDFVRVRVRGEFPRAGSSQFISSDVVAACRKYKAEGIAALPKILAVDVARFGDDQTVLGCRQGRNFEILNKYRGKDGVFVANRIIELQEQEKFDAIIVDGDGGWSGSVVDHLKFCRFDKNVHEFHGSPDANDGRWFNRRTEVWGLMKEWLENGAQIPDSPELAADLVGPEFDYTKGKRRPGSLFIEHKDDMKARGLSSPDLADCLALTFAVKVAPPVKAQPPPKPVSAWS